MPPKTASTCIIRSSLSKPTYPSSSNPPQTSPSPYTSSSASPSAPVTTSKSNGILTIASSSRTLYFPSVNLSQINTYTFGKIYPETARLDEFSACMDGAVEEASEGRNACIVVIGDDKYKRTLFEGSEEDGYNALLAKTTAGIFQALRVKNQMAEEAGAEGLESVECKNRLSLSWYSMNVSKSEGIVDMLRASSSHLSATTSPETLIDPNLTLTSNSSGVSVKGLWEIEIKDENDVRDILKRVRSDDLLNSNLYHNIVTVKIEAIPFNSSKIYKSNGSASGDAGTTCCFSVVTLAGLYQSSDLKWLKHFNYQLDTLLQSNKSKYTTTQDSSSPSSNLMKSKLGMLLSPLLTKNLSSTSCHGQVVSVIDPSLEKAEESVCCFEFGGKILSCCRDADAAAAADDVDDVLTPVPTNDSDGGVDHEGLGSYYYENDVNQSMQSNQAHSGNSKYNEMMRSYVSPNRQQKQQQQQQPQQQQQQQQRNPHQPPPPTPLSPTPAPTSQPRQPQRTTTINQPPPPPPPHEIDPAIESEIESDIIHNLTLQINTLTFENQSLKETLNSQGSTLKTKDRQLLRQALGDVRDYEVYKDVMESTFSRMKRDIDVLISEKEELNGKLGKCERGRRKEQAEIVTLRSEVEKFVRERLAGESSVRSGKVREMKDSRSAENDKKKALFAAREISNLRGVVGELKEEIRVLRGASDAKGGNGNANGDTGKKNIQNSINKARIQGQAQAQAQGQTNGVGVGGNSRASLAPITQAYNSKNDAMLISQGLSRATGSLNAARKIMFM